MVSRRDRARSITFLLMAALSWSLGGLLIKSVDWNPLAISGMRSAIASLVILAYLRRPRFTWSSAQIGGALCYAATVILFVAANRTTTAANAILLQYGAPVYVALWGHRLLGERTSRSDWLAVVMVLGGMTLFFLDELEAGTMAGNVMAVGSGLAFAMLILFLRMQKDGSPIESCLLGNIVAALIGFPFMLQSSPGPGSWTGLILLGTVQVGLAYILYTIAIRGVTAMEASLIPVIEPILNPLWVFLALGEVPGNWALTGGAVILITMVVRYLLPAWRRERKEALG